MSQFPTAKVGKAVADALARGAPSIDPADLPDLKDMSPASITDNVIKINSLCKSPRQKFVFEKVVRHLHDLIREVSLTSDEWMETIQFLTKTGQICTELRQEFILLSDILGVSALVDSMNHPVPEGSNATEATVLGPFFVEESKDIGPGESIASEGKGEYMYVTGLVTDLEGKPIPNVLIETWETDEDGFYDTQYSSQQGETWSADCRGRVRTNSEGRYAFRGVRPVAYPIPNDGPVGKLLRSLNRHVFRPSHLHMMLIADGFEPLTTALYPKGDIYINSDAVFGVKSSLCVDLVEVTDNDKATSLGFAHGPYWSLDRDFVLITKEQAEVEKRKSLTNYYASIQK